MSHQNKIVKERKLTEEILCMIMDLQPNKYATYEMKCGTYCLKVAESNGLDISKLKISKSYWNWWKIISHRAHNDFLNKIRYSLFHQEYCFYWGESYQLLRTIPMERLTQIHAQIYSRYMNDADLTELQNLIK